MAICIPIRTSWSISFDPRIIFGLLHVRAVDLASLARYGPVTLVYIARYTSHLCLEHTYPSEALVLVCTAQ